MNRREPPGHGPGSSGNRAGLALPALILALLVPVTGCAPPVNGSPDPGGRAAGARHVAKRAWEWWQGRVRALTGPVDAAPPGLAASQVGYGPGMRKAFTSERPFGSFRVVRVHDGSVALTGGSPARSVDTDLLGTTRTAWVGDFSDLREPGRYRLETDDGLASYPFDVGPWVFDRPLRAVQRWFYFQRAFTAVDGAHAEGPWVHPSDAAKAPPGTVKGWHDAGDFTVYNATTSVAIFWMLEAFADFQPRDDDTNIPESGNGVPDLLDEARWGLEWMLSVQDPAGGFQGTTCQDRYGPYGTNTPEGVPPYRPGEVGTIATARAVGILAHASVVFRPFDEPFAQRCLEAAHRGDRWLAARPDEHSDGPSCPGNRRDGDPIVGRHVRMFAAAGMLLATGDPRHRDAFERNYEEITRIPDYARMNGYAARLYLRADAADPGRKRALRLRLGELADGVRADGAAHPHGWATHYYWGSLGDGFHRTGIFGIPSCLEDPAGSAHCDQALANVHYALGRNSRRFCYVSGLPGTSRGVTWSFHHWLRALDARPYAFPGIVPAGPSRDPEARDTSFPAARPVPIWGYWGDPAMPRSGETPVDGRYTDNDSWSTNEGYLVWQGAALYSLHLARSLARASAPR